MIGMAVLALVQTHLIHLSFQVWVKEVAEEDWREDQIMVSSYHKIR